MAMPSEKRTRIAVAAFLLMVTNVFGQQAGVTKQAATAQKYIAGELAGVTVQVLPDPPKSSAMPQATVNGPTFDQTMQWMAETAPQNLTEGPMDHTGLVTSIVPGSTCSKTGLVFSQWWYNLIHKVQFDPKFAWITVDLGGINPASVISTGSKVEFGSYTSQYILVVNGASVKELINSNRKGRNLKSSLTNTFTIDEFSTPDYAQRFANALKHAVEVCGGVASDTKPPGQPF